MMPYRNTPPEGAVVPYEYNTEGHQSNNGDVGNTFLDRLSRAVESCYEHLSASGVWREWLGPRPVSQCSFVDVDQTVQSHKVIYRQIVQRSAVTPYTFKFHDPAHVITGIACGPKDDKTSSPEAEVVDGGVGFRHVVIRLSPVQNGAWACCVQINGVEENN